MCSECLEWKIAVAAHLEKHRGKHRAAIFRINGGPYFFCNRVNLLIYEKYFCEYRPHEKEASNTISKLLVCVCIYILTHNLNY